MYSGLTSDTAISNGYPAYNTTASGYQREIHSNNGTEQYTRIQSSAGTSVANEMRSGYESSVAYDQSQYPQQSTCAQNYPLGSGGIKILDQPPGLAYEQSDVHFNPNGINDKVSFVGPSLGFNSSVVVPCGDKPSDDGHNAGCAQPQRNEETAGTENFGEIISKTMVEGVIV